MAVRIGWKRAVLLVVAVAAAGLLFAWSGLFLVSASSGHWPITAWFLHWTMENSVRTYSMGIDAPALDDPAMIRRGAGHYATGCAPCHGAPGAAQNPVILEQTPHPPPFSQLNAHWKDRELFWIVKHGVKFTGMPAWPARVRDDEVWSVVAFLRTLPGLSEDEYQRLAYGGETPASEIAGADLARLSQPAATALADCARCHGRDGLGQGDDAFPILAEQSERYLREALSAFADGRRHSGIMQLPAHRLTDETRAEIAAHYAAQAAPEPAGADTPEIAELGAAIARDGLPGQGVPACLSCHGAEAVARNPSFPRLDGQPVDYLANQLRLFKDDARGGGPYAHLMAQIAGHLRPEQVEAVAAYFAAGGERATSPR